MNNLIVGARISRLLEDLKKIESELCEVRSSLIEINDSIEITDVVKLAEDTLLSGKITNTKDRKILQGLLWENSTVGGLTASDHKYIEEIVIHYLI